MTAPLSQLVTEQTKNLIATGVNQTETAEQVGISRRSVNGIAKNYKKQIEQLALDIINESVPLIRANHINTLKTASKVLASGDLKQIEASKTLLTLADKKEFRTLQIMGIAPSHAASVIITNLFSIDTLQVVDPGVRAALGTQLDDILNSEDVTEAEYTDDNE